MHSCKQEQKSILFKVYIERHQCLLWQRQHKCAIISYIQLVMLRYAMVETTFTFSTHPKIWWVSLTSWQVMSGWVLNVFQKIHFRFEKKLWWWVAVLNTCVKKSYNQLNCCKHFSEEVFILFGKFHKWITQIALYTYTGVEGNNDIINECHIM